ncbi:hypothetical protein Hanom_Chr10g00947441 [Helianthus anomalus]
MPHDIRRQQTMCVGLDGIQVPNFNNFTSIQLTKHCLFFLDFAKSWMGCVRPHFNVGSICNGQNRSIKSIINR